jgi:hypothetical protein
MGGTKISPEAVNIAGLTTEILNQLVKKTSEQTAQFKARY